jgi:hypothetical protein
MTFTGTASYNIDGRTIHATLFKTKGKRSLAFKQKLNTSWSSVTCQIIDKISICPKYLLEEVDSELRQVSGKEKVYQSQLLKSIHPCNNTNQPDGFRNLVGWHSTIISDHVIHKSSLSIFSV